MDSTKALTASIFVVNCVSAIASESETRQRVDVAWQKTSAESVRINDPSPVVSVEGALLQGQVPSDDLVYTIEKSEDNQNTSGYQILEHPLTVEPELYPAIGSTPQLIPAPDVVGTDDSLSSAYNRDGRVVQDLPIDAQELDAIEICPLPEPFVNETPLFNEKLISFKNRLAFTRRSVGRGYVSLSEKLDSFFAGRTYGGLDENKSRLAVQTANTWLETGHQQADVRVRASIDLPNTEQRYKVFLESDPREENTLQDRTRSVSRGEQVSRDSSVLGLQFSKPKEDPSKWRSDLSLGARFRSGIKPLVRGRLRKYMNLSENWHSYFRQDIWHLESVGWGETSRWELTRPLGDWFRFRWMAELEYRDEDDPLAYANTYTLFQNVNEDLQIVYVLGLLGEGSESKMEDDRFANVTFKYRLYQDWIFIDFTPEYFFAEDQEYDGELSYTVTLKVWFTDRNR